MVTDAMAVRFYTFFFEHPSSGCTFSIPGQVPPVKGIFCIAVICFLYGSHFRVGGRAAFLIFLIEVRAGALVQIKAQSVAFPELKPGRRYRVAMGDYIFKAYSGLDYTAGAPTGTLLTDVLDSYLRARSPLAPDNEPRQRIE